MDALGSFCARCGIKSPAYKAHICVRKQGQKLEFNSYCQYCGDNIRVSKSCPKHKCRKKLA